MMQDQTFKSVEASEMINIWALEKNLEIKALLVRLTNVIDTQAMMIIHSSPEEYNAIGLAKPDEPDIWAYVYTFGQAPDCYGIHLQFPKLPDNRVDGAIDARENVTFEALLDILITHLDIPAAAIHREFDAN